MKWVTLDPGMFQKIIDSKLTIQKEELPEYLNYDKLIFYLRKKFVKERFKSNEGDEYFKNPLGITCKNKILKLGKINNNDLELFNIDFK